MSIEIQMLKSKFFEVLDFELHLTFRFWALDLFDDFRFGFI